MIKTRIKITVPTLYTCDCPTIKTLLDLWGCELLDTEGRQGGPFVQLPGGRMFYALTPSSLERWCAHIRDCYDTADGDAYEYGAGA